MSDRLTDEQVQVWIVPDYDPDITDYERQIASMAREVQECRALRPDCPTCGGPVLGHKPGCDQYCGDPTCVAEWRPACDDCTDGKVPLDKWVALLVQTLAPLPASLADIALTIPSCSHSDPQEGDCDWLLRAHVRRIEAVLKMAEAAR